MNKTATPAITNNFNQNNKKINTFSKKTIWKLSYTLRSVTTNCVN